MLNSFRKLPAQVLGGSGQSLVFFVLFYMYFWLKIDPRLIYHCGGAITNFPYFYRGWAFLQEFLLRPGGLVEYISAFLVQFFYYSWIGAFIVTLQAWLIFICTAYFLKAIKARQLYWLRFVPPILVLITYNRYAFYFVTTTALLAAMLFVCLYLRIASKSKLVRLAVFLALSVVLYIIAGGAYLLFAMFCMIYEVFFEYHVLEKSQTSTPFKGSWQIAVVYLLSALLIPYVIGVSIFNISIIDAFSRLLPFSWEILSYTIRKKMVTALYLLYLLLPLTSLGIGLWQMFVKGRPLFSRPNNIKTQGFAKENNSRCCRLVDAVRHWWSFAAVKTTVLFVLIGVVVFLSHNIEMKTLLEVDYYAHHKRWQQVIETSRRYPNSAFIACAVNQAFYHTGRLGYDMFRYSQSPETLILSNIEQIFVNLKRHDILIDLGYMNMAEQDLNDSIGMYGEHPVILKRLALVNMVKGDIDTARVYLGALSKTLFEADWADDYLYQLEQDRTLAMDERIQSLRNLMQKEDTALISFDGTSMLPKLLAANRQNRMAFEYLMAWYLLNGDMDGFVRNLYRLDDFNYPEIPQLYEEAILYIFATGKKVDLQGRRISRQSHQRFDGFNRTLRRYGGDKQAAFNELRKNYGDTFLFYGLYGVSGVE